MNFLEAKIAACPAPNSKTIFSCSASALNQSGDKLEGNLRNKDVAFLVKTHDVVI